jgi:shikimate kinase
MHSQPGLALEPMTQLVVITGPIASGKSVVANALANRLNAAIRSVAVADLDDTVASMDASPEDLELTWDRAREVHSDLVGQLLSSGVDVVIAHGPFYSANETSALLRHVPAGIGVRRVMLLTTYEVALERVTGDPRRGLSKDPVFLRSTYERFLQLQAGIEVCEWTFNTTKSSVDEIVTTITEALLPI